MNIRVFDIDLEMVFIPGGRFLMGANCEDKYAPKNETPAHVVSLSQFYMSKFQIGKKLWEKVMGTPILDTWNNNKVDPPAEAISWEQAQQFIAKLNSLTGKKFCLPSEAQWEYVARGGENGNDYFIEAGNYRHNYSNSLGICDLLVNNLEWCEDEFYDYTEMPCVNPTHASILHKYKVLRGGGPDCGEKSYRVSFRSSDYYDSDCNLSGSVYAFRVVLNDDNNICPTIISRNNNNQQDDYLNNYLRNDLKKDIEKDISLSPSNRDLAFSMTDEFGVKYSSDGKKLLKGAPGIKDYIVREGTETICSFAWNDDNYFYDDVCLLESIVFPDSLKHIGDCAFSGCIHLNNVRWSSNIIYIGDFAFKDCKLNISLPSKIKCLGFNPFIGCISISSKEPLDFYHINNNTIYSKDGFIIISCCCQQSTFEFPPNTIIAGVASFMNNKCIKSVVIRNSVRTICADSFCGCTNLNSVTIGKYIKKIYGNPFAGNKGISVCNESRSFRVKEDLIINPITKTLISCCSKSDTIRIPDEVENIGEYAFSENSNVRNIYAPYSLKHIQKGAFKWCEHLNLHFYRNIESIDKTAFEGRPYGCKVISSVTLYDVNEKSYVRQFFKNTMFYNVYLKNNGIK